MHKRLFPILTTRAALTSILALLIPPLLPGCNGSHSILDPASATAAVTASLWWGMLIGFSAVLVVVVVLWLYAMSGTMTGKSRSPDSNRSRLIGRRWIVGGGVILPLSSIAVLLAFGLPLGHRMLPNDSQAALRIEVIGHQWWWEVRYPEAGVITANQLHLPAGRPVDVEVSAADVIHSFWVPRLAGKIDMIPGHRNVIRLQADRPGTYPGQCSEFCGLQHAHMAFAVEAQTEAAFAQWLKARQTAPAISPNQRPAVSAFQQHCGRCHRVAGVSAGQQGPDLTDVAARPTLGAGTLAQTEGALLRWLQEHQSLKPGNRMPDHSNRLPAETLAAIAAWLETLSPSSSESGSGGP